MNSKVMTVLGPIDPEEVGIALPHEHLVVDLTAWWQEHSDASMKALAHAKVDLANLGAIRRDPMLYRDNCHQLDARLAAEELWQFKLAGGKTLVDLTNHGLGRDPLALKAIAIQTGMQIVMGSGYYIARAHPPDMDQRSIEDIAAEITRDLTEGAGDTGIRAGIIGEIGTSGRIRPNEEKTLRAAARAQRRTGAAINVHLLPWVKRGLNILDILEAEGVDLSRVALSHLSPTADDLDYHLAIARRGAYVEYDFFGMELYFDSVGAYTGSDWDAVTRVKRLIDHGYLEQLLLSHDIGMKVQLCAFGGWGFAHLLNHVVPMFKRVGITQTQLDTLLSDNPRRLLAWTKATG
jgi:phosphotriesterase-related protein